MKQVTLSALMLAMAFWSDKVLADEKPKYLFGYDPLLATISLVKVHVEDDVKGGCFTNADAVKTAAELVLRKNGMPVDESAVDVFYIYLFGGGDKAVSGRDLGCSVVVKTSIDLGRGVYVPYGNGALTIATVSVSLNEHLLTGPGDERDRVRLLAIESAEKLMNEVLRSRAAVFDENPDIKASFERPRP
jgi:hypothetical protein